MYVRVAETIYIITTSPDSSLEISQHIFFNGWCSDELSGILAFGLDFL